MSGTTSEVVKQYEMIDGHDYYTATVCDEEDITQDCNTLENFYYVLKNKYPATQSFPFAETDTNRQYEKVLVPKRIMQDERAIDEFIRKNAIEQECFDDVRPLDQYSSRLTCRDEDQQSPQQKKKPQPEEKDQDARSPDPAEKEKEEERDIFRIPPWAYAIIIVIMLAIIGVLLYAVFVA